MHDLKNFLASIAAVTGLSINGDDLKSILYTSSVSITVHFDNYRAQKSSIRNPQSIATTGMYVHRAKAYK